eukprot:gene1701-1995_t
MGISLLEDSRQLNDEDRESLLMMKGATSFMQETLNDVLCMQKIEEGKLELTYAPFRAVDVVQVVRSVLQGTMSQKSIHLCTLVYDDVPEFVIGDRFRIEHVLANLLSNAIKFSPSHGRIFMIVSLVGGCGSASAYLQAEDSVNVTRPSAQTRAYTNTSKLSKFVQLEFSVRDEGPGISLADQKKLFQDFVQIKPGEMQGGGGSGVGLSLCKQIVELHDGTIRCSSEVGQGATFSFIIPFKIHFDDLQQDCNNNMESKSVRVEEEVKSPKISPVQSSYFQIVGVGDVSITGEEGELGLLTLCDKEILPKSKASSIRQSVVFKSNDERKSGTLLENTLCACLGTSEDYGTVAWPQDHWHILLVDDSAVNLQLLSKLLEKRGFSCDKASDGLQALEAVERRVESNPYDVIFMDSNMPNMDGLTATKALRERGFDRLIVGLTGSVMEDDVNAFIAAGADGVFSKPLQSDQLNEFVLFLKKNGNGRLLEPSRDTASVGKLPFLRSSTA